MLLCHLLEIVWPLFPTLLTLSNAVALQVYLSFSLTVMLLAMACAAARVRVATARKVPSSVQHHESPARYMYRALQGIGIADSWLHTYFCCASSASRWLQGRWRQQLWSCLLVVGVMILHIVC